MTAHALNAHPLVEVQDLSIQRGEKQILEKVCWRILPGEQWVILGPNGSGKTSLLAALTGYLFPSSGEIRMLGETFGESDWRDLRKYIGIVSSNIGNRLEDSEIALHAIISGKEAVINSWKTPTASERKEALRILNLVECSHLAEQAWATLSQGERQRILIGRALMAKPKLLILDEACSGLDPVAREHFLQFIQRLTKADTPITLIFVTHHLEEITPAFTHILMLREGRAIASGPVKECITSSQLTTMFDFPVKVHKQGTHYTLSMNATKGVAV